MAETEGCGWKLDGQMQVRKKDKNRKTIYAAVLICIGDEVCPECPNGHGCMKKYGLYLKIVEGALPEPLDTQINEEIRRLNKLRNFEDYEIGLLLPRFYCPHCRENGGCQWTWTRFPEFVLPYQRAVMSFFTEEIENVRDCNGGTKAMEDPLLRKSAGWKDSRSKWEKIFPIYIAYYDHIQHGSPGDFFLYIWGVRCYPSGIIKCRVSLTSIWNTLKRSASPA
ncbi:MAG: hypothetical protein LUI10_07165 [Lachnospiraceae bacterium]|nr:hypothetical protein [Lachnospiraceae bacterium]